MFLSIKTICTEKKITLEIDLFKVFDDFFDEQGFPQVLRTREAAPPRVGWEGWGSTKLWVGGGGELESLHGEHGVLQMAILKSR